MGYLRKGIKKNRYVDCCKLTDYILFCDSGGSAV